MISIKLTNGPVFTDKGQQVQFLQIISMSTMFSEHVYILSDEVRSEVVTSGRSMLYIGAGSERGGRGQGLICETFYGN